MPAKKVVSKEEITACAVRILEREGGEKLNARRVAAEVGCSTQPIYLSCANMEELKAAVALECKIVFGEYLEREKQTTFFKKFVKAYLRFAAEKPKMFSFLYLENPFRNDVADVEFEKKTIKYISDVGGYDREIAERFYYSTWFFVHGIAVQTVNGYGEFDPKYVDTLLDDQFAAMKKYYGELSNGKHNG